MSRNCYSQSTICVYEEKTSKQEYSVVILLFIVMKEVWATTLQNVSTSIFNVKLNILSTSLLIKTHHEKQFFTEYKEHNISQQ